MNAAGTLPALRRRDLLVHIGLLTPIVIVALLLLWAVPRDISRRMVDVFDQLTLDKARYAAAAPRILQQGNPVVILAFDEKSMVASGASPRAPTIPQNKLAQLLDQLREHPAARPAAVFLDVGVLETAVAGDTATLALAAAFARWAVDPKARILGVVPGNACAARKHFDPAIFPAVASPDRSGRIDPAAKVIWACPMIEARRWSQVDWVCAVRAPDKVFGPLPSNIALPSVGWLGAEARRRAIGAAPGRPPALVERLTGATKACRQAGPSRTISETDVPMLRGGSAALTKARAGGDRLITIVPAIEALAEGYDDDINRDAVVVIGQNHYFIDELTSSGDAVAGAMAVGLALRDALRGGTEARLGAIPEAIVAVSITLTIYFSGVALHALRHRSFGGDGLLRRAARFLILQEQLIVLLLILAVFFVSGVFGTPLALPLALGVIFGEVSLYIRHKVREWDETT